jgi:hypothetical protein
MGELFPHNLRELSSIFRLNAVSAWFCSSSPTAPPTEAVVLIVIKRHMPGNGPGLMNADIAQRETSSSGASLDTCPPATTRYSQPVLPLFCISCAISLIAK